MKDKKVLAVLAAALVVLLGGAGFLYNRLSGSVEHDMLAVIFRVNCKNGN